MNEVIVCDVLRHTIFKCIRDLHKHNRDDIPRVGEFDITSVGPQDSTLVVKRSY